MFCIIRLPKCPGHLPGHMADTFCTQRTACLPFFVIHVISCCGKPHLSKTNVTKPLVPNISNPILPKGLKYLWQLLEWKTSLLRRLQAQTLPDATPPIGKINPSSKIAVTFEPMM